jgi:DNA-binding transcriptional MerR regulator
MQRAGNRRYYRTADVELVRRIDRLLNQEGYTVRGVQKLLRGRSDVEPPRESPVTIAAARDSDPEEGQARNGVDDFRLIALRNRLADALDR